MPGCAVLKLQLLAQWDWCAKNFHLKLLPLLAKKIHAWKSEELQRLMESVLSDLDSEVLKSAAAFSGSSAVLALLLGDRLFISAVGQFRVVLLYDDQSSRELMKGVDLAQDAERIEEAKGHLRKDMLIRVPDSESNDAERVLMARNPFQVLQMEPNGLDEKQVRTQYRKVALKVHPDKQTEDAQSFKKAFARLDGAKEVLESLCSADKASVLELHQTLQAEVHTREGAAALLGVDSTPTTETEHLVEEAAKASRMGIKKLEKLEHLVRAEYDLAVATYKEAVETLRRPSSKEALARQEALRLQPLPMGRALGCRAPWVLVQWTDRDMRFPAALVAGLRFASNRGKITKKLEVVMRPESVSWQVQRGVRVALLCGATASLTDQQLLKSSTSFKRCPKASALRWCQELQSNSVVAACLRCEAKGGETEGSRSKIVDLRYVVIVLQEARKGKAPKALEGRSIFLRHILFKHQQLRVLDPAARREGAARGAHEAETTALQVLQRLLVEPNAFVKLCREHSDCASAEQPGTLAGHMGWVARNEQEPPMEDAWMNEE
ncbi:DnaJ homolog subfamily C member 8 [Durusdinium trenchii]|uniref:DnaJ homolog subfamily C member 8 n=1 Tax=Durusdinium trenchii TaxID=1381693 RepID=A0ABP0KKT3_9DINO